MKITTVILCLVGAVSANPILHRVDMEPCVSESNATQSLSGSQSSDQSDTSELQSSEENTSEDTSENQTSESESESESLESNSDDESSEKSQSQSLQDTNTSHEMGVTSDNSLGSEENIRKSWIRMFANVIQVLSPKVNGSVKVKGQPDHQNVEEGEQLHTSIHTTTAMTVNRKGTTVPSNGDIFLVESISQPLDGQIATIPREDHDDREGCDISNVPEANTDSSESSETSEASDSSDTSESTESETSDSADTQQMETRDCRGGVDSTACDSDEYVFQDIGDDAHYPVEHLMMPEEVHELHLRR
ncbi:secretory calcium-binding phosphoprotein 1 [Osmerus mordax]|uniref:secretory calcium-binding phosphoprotein 1 n=1 Tax=Osmerus mordax TaxID=8014 RepID=UPI00350F565D